MPIEKTCRLRTPPPVPMIELVRLQSAADRLDHGVDHAPPAVDDRAAADLDDVAVAAACARPASRSSADLACRAGSRA